MVATVHLDTQWRWTIQDTIRRFLPDTLHRNFALFERLPWFVLSFEGAFRYMLVREYYPAEWERLKEWVAAGRWRPAGTMLDAPDVNVVSPESLIRHVLYADRFFERELGRRSRDLFLPDCFGFGRAVPSVAAHCGLLGFSSQKFGNWSDPEKLPFEVGWWEGPDGAAVLAALRPGGYGEGLGEDLGRSTGWAERLDRLADESGLGVGLKYVGIGDRGGALDEESLGWLEASLRDGGPVRVVLDGSDRLFRDLSAADEAARKRLPRHRGELLLPTHGTGCLTSQATLKRRNRRCEQLADAAERAAAAAALLGAAPYPQEALNDAWLRFLWHQMHDDLTGTSIPAAYRFTDNDQVLALNRFAGVLTEAVAAVARGLDTAGEGLPLVVYNPLSIDREDLVEAVVRLPAGVSGVRVLDPVGTAVPCQSAPAAGGRHRLVFLARVPAVGFAVYRVLAADEQASDGTGAIARGRTGHRADAGLRVDAAGLENHRYRVTLDAGGDVVSIHDKRLDRELLAAPVRLQLLADRSTRWPAWEVQYRTVAAPAREFVGGPAEVRVAERGPARVALEVRRRARGSRFVQRVRLAAGGAGERVEWLTEIDWGTRGRLLKAVFPLTARHPEATFDLGLGAIRRGNRRPERYEVPAQQWADLTDRSGEWGASVLDDCKYGWDKPDHGTLRLSLLRAPRTFRKFRHQATQDHGRHRMIWALAGHAGSWQDGGVAWQAARLNQPLMAFECPPSPGPLGRTFSLLSIDDPAVAARAFKQAEDGDGWVLRLQELTGRRTGPVRIQTAAAIAGAVDCDGCERPLAGELGNRASQRGGRRSSEGPDASGAPSSEATSSEAEDGAAEAAGTVRVTAAAEAMGETVPASADGRGADPRRAQAAVRDGRLELGLGGFAPRTVRLRLALPGVALEPLTAHKVAFDRDLEVASSQGRPVDFDGRGRSFPAELIPARVESGGVVFELAPAGERPRGLACRGQTLELPAAGPGRLLLLAATVGGDVRASFDLGDQPRELKIHDWTEPVGRRERRRWGRRQTGWIKRQPVAWYATHRHDREGGDEPYVFCYLFRYSLAVPAGCRTIGLPDQPRVRLFAATFLSGPAEALRAATPLYD